MIDRIYIENEVRNHPRTQEILRRFPSASRIRCRRYGEVFNVRNQSFRLQKRRPALILAHKFGPFVLETPEGFGIGGDRNFYFAHMLNCVYDCRYCFLQGMYSSAHYVVFVNYEDFVRDIRERLDEDPSSEAYFFSGYDCDSLALDAVTGFTDYFLPQFEGLDRAWLELRTKSVHTRSLLKRRPHSRVIAAFSLTPDSVARSLEHRAPTVTQRIQAMRELASRGWKIGLRIDPLIQHDGFEQSYRDLFRTVFRHLDPDAVHSVSLGPLRFPKEMYGVIAKLYPEAPILAGGLETRGRFVSYQEEIEERLHGYCRESLLEWVPEEKLFSCSGVSP